METIIRRPFPVGVKIISVLIYSLAGLMTILGVYLLLAAAVLSFISNSNQMFYSFIGYTNIKGFILQGSLELILGIFGFILARGLWKAKNQARMATIWFTILVIIFCEFYLSRNLFTKATMTDYFLFSILPGFLVLLILGIICIYLAFNKKVKRTFLK